MDLQGKHSLIAYGDDQAHAQGSNSLSRNTPAYDSMYLGLNQNSFKASKDDGSFSGST